jgi:hypothetical protein
VKPNNRSEKLPAMKRRPRKKPSQLSRSAAEEMAWATALATPFHEAGHVVAGLLFGTDRPHVVSVEWTEKTSGHVIATFTSPKEQAQRARRAIKATPASRSFFWEQAQRNCMVDLAGTVAEEIVIGAPPTDVENLVRRSGGIADLRNAHTRLAPFIKTARARTAVLKVLRQHVFALLSVRRVQAAIEAFADVLNFHESGTLVDPELSEELARVEEAIGRKLLRSTSWWRAAAQDLAARQLTASGRARAAGRVT